MDKLAPLRWFASVRLWVGRGSTRTGQSVRTANAMRAEKQTKRERICIFLHSFRAITHKIMSDCTTNVECHQLIHASKPLCAQKSLFPDPTTSFSSTFWNGHRWKRKVRLPFTHTHTTSTMKWDDHIFYIFVVAQCDGHSDTNQIRHFPSQSAASLMNDRGGRYAG